MPSRTCRSVRFFTLIALCAACFCALALTACSGQGEAGFSKEKYIDANYVTIADSSLVGRDIHIHGTVDFPYHDDASDWQGYLIAVDGVSTDIVAAWYDAAPDSEWAEDGSAVEIWGTLDGLDYTDTNGDKVGIPHMTIKVIEATTLEQPQGDEDGIAES